VVGAAGRGALTMIKELLTREDFYDSLLGGEGVIVVVDDVRGRTAHPTTCPTLEAAHFVEKVIVNKRRNGRYYWAGSFPEASRELDAQPCQCPP
jgi:hypothetical protein